MTEAVGQSPANPSWSDLIDEKDWLFYREVIEQMLQAGLPFAVGGGLAFSAYARRWRKHKDIDLYVLPQDRQAMIEIITRAGFEDYYDRKPYDRNWLYRGYRKEVIVDVMWELANHKEQVDRDWLVRGPLVDLRGLQIRILPVEELIWTKLHILQRDRCDWPDLLSLLYAEGSQLDWEHLVRRVRDDERLLSGLLYVFSWTCPQHASQLPNWVWQRLQVAPPQKDLSEEQTRRRVDLLDSRDWFGPKDET